MEELHKIIKKKYKDFDITPQHLGNLKITKINLFKNFII